MQETDLNLKESGESFETLSKKAYESFESLTTKFTNTFEKFEKKWKSWNTSQVIDWLKMIDYPKFVSFLLFNWQKL